MILLTLSRGKGEETVRLQLPASPAEIGETFAFLDRISLDTTATAILDVSSNVPVLYRCLYDVDVEDSEQFQKLQKLAERTEALSPAKAAIFSGALDAECVWNLEGALTVADRLDEYTQLLTDDSDPDHPLEIAIITPRPEHDYYTLVTVGLSRHRMGFPEERWEEKLERAELLINLPRDWKLTKADCREERWSWPIRMMLATAHFAMEDPEVGLESRTTLDEGEDGIPFAENTELRGEILLCPGVFGTDSFFCRLPDGDEVNFYQVIPLYREEIQYKLEHGSDALLDLCPDESLEVINPHRLNVVTDREKISYDPAEMDNAAEQIKKIRALHLPVDELDAYNRMAFFLGWAMKRGQMSNPFLSRHREVVEAVWAGKGPDLRAFILNKLDGKLSTQFFDRRGSGFAQWYAQDNRSNPYIYRRDCRNIVLAESKDRVWNSIAEKDAAYLLLP